MSDHKERDGRQLTAYILLGLAAYILLSQVGVLDFLGIGNLIGWMFRTIWSLLPSVITAAGIYWIIQSRPGSKPLAAWLVTGLGAAMLVSQFGIFDLSFGALITPLILVIVAIMILSPRELLPKRLNTQGSEIGEDQENIELMAFMGGGELSYTSQKLRGGEIICIMGGFDLDFREADMAEDTMVINVICIMGGFELKVPAHWEVEKRGAICIMGGYSNKTKCIAEELEMPRKKLIVKGFALMGGGEFKN